MVDTSGSVDDREFKEVINFLKQTVREFKIGKDGTHIGIIQYDSKATLVFDFKKYDTLKGVERGIDTIINRKGLTRIDRALKLADQDLFSDKGGWRRDRAQVGRNRTSIWTFFSYENMMFLRNVPRGVL